MDGMNPAGAGETTAEENTASAAQPADQSQGGQEPVEGSETPAEQPTDTPA